MFILKTNIYYVGDNLKIYEITENNLVDSSINEAINNKEKFFWIIFTPYELEKSYIYFNFNYSTVYNCLHEDDYPKLEIFENYSFGILNLIEKNNNFFIIHEINFYITKNHIIFISEKNLDIFEELKENIRSKGALRLSIDKILYNLLDSLTSNDYNILSDIEQELNEVEKDIMQGKTKDYLKDIVQLKKKLLFIKKHYEPLLGISEDLSENENNILDENSVRYFVILFNRISRLNSSIDNLRDYTTQIRESYHAQLDVNTNNIMRIFTIITSIFSALSLIVGWYGMNFKSMPEFNWSYGYIFVIILCIFVVLLCILLFKKKKLL